LAIGKGDDEALFNLALMYHIQEKYTEAEKYYLLAIEKGDDKALFNLALIYDNQEKYTEAEKYYLLSIETGELNGYNNLAVMYYQANSNKKQALEYIIKACDLGTNPIYKEPQIIIEIWNGIFKDVENRVISLIKEKNFDNVEDLIQELLVQQQKTIVWHLFDHSEIGKLLQEKYLVLYYVTLIQNNLLENNLLLRIPPELQSSIDDILSKINERQKFYGSQI